MRFRRLFPRVRRARSDVFAPDVPIPAPDGGNDDAVSAFDASMSSLVSHRNTSGLMCRHVTVQAVMGGFSFYDEAGFDLTPAELDELTSTLAELAGAGSTLGEVRAEASAAAGRHKDRLFRCAAGAGLPGHWREGGLAGFGFNLDGGRFSDTEIVRQGDQGLVYLDGSGADSSFFGHSYSTTGVGRGLVRGPWVWQDDGCRWADPARTVEAVLMRAVARRGGVGTIEEIFAAGGGTGVERAVWHSLLHPGG